MIMNQNTKDILYAFSASAIYISLYLYNWYIQRTVEIDDYDTKGQQEDLEKYFKDLVDDNLWLMTTLSVILNYWIAEVIILIFILIF
jgi:hypothetical protein